MYPSSSPTNAPTDSPSASPSGSFYPSSAPSDAPTDSMYPSSSPTNNNAATDKPFETMAPTDSTDAPTPCPPSLPILIENQGDTMYPDLPVIITQQNTTHVGFKVENTFATTVSSIFTEYHSGSFGETECLEEENVEEKSQVETEFLATCMHHTHISVINVWVTDCDDELPPFLVPADNAQVPECCHPSEKQCKTVQYTFKLPCISPCPDDDDDSDVSIMPIIPKVPITTRPIIPEIIPSTTKPIPEVPITKPKPPQVINNVGGLRNGHRRRNLATTNVRVDDDKKEEGSTIEFENITGQHHEPDDDE